MKKLKKSKFLKILPVSLLTYLSFVNVGFCDVVSEVEGGGDIQSSKLAQGLFDIIRDLSRNITMDNSSFRRCYDFIFYF